MEKPKVAAITVSVDTPENLRWGGALPIEVRDHDSLVVAARGLSEGRLDLPEGRYVISALLPDGQRATVEELVDLKQGDMKQVHLSVMGLDFPERLQTKASLADSFRQTILPVTKYFSSQNSAVMHGDVLAVMLDPGRGSMIREPTALSRAHVPFSETKTWIEIRTGGKCIYFAVPVDVDGKTTVQWHLQPSGGLEIKFDFHDGVTNAFLDFIENDQAFEARSIGQSIIRRSESYLIDKGKSPLRAILGAYVLLRANELDEMDSWTSQLMSRCRGFPDALAVRVEYLARTGRHQEAVHLILDLAGWGAPWIRSGIGYLDTRAKLYATVVASRRTELSLDDGELKQLARIAEVLRGLATAMDMSHYTTVLRDMDPIS